MKCKKYSYIIAIFVMILVGVKSVYALPLSAATTENALSKVSEYSLLMAGGTDEIECEDLFGDKNDPNSIRYLVDEVLQIPRIVVPVLIILLGAIDMASAVIATKEDGMKKAQVKFVKRLVIGVAIFLVPVFVDAIMYLADIVWAGTGLSSCGI